ncbi:MAG TPA: potassium channel family protein [Candidatus Dormibacteraeota bacterium]|jgi:voltage-gated potassium channel|nr:potassium channel family protein [Candidatus Dormibacteraeota bacterium]
MSAATSRVEVRAVEALVVVAAFATIPLTLAEWEHPNHLGFLIADWMFWSVFVIELVLLLILSRRERRILATTWLTVIVVVVSCPLVPALLAGSPLAELAPLARLLRVARLAGAASVAFPVFRRILRPGLIMVIGVTTLLVFSAAGMFVIFEPSVHGSYWAAVWFSIVTATGVGYGDISPHSVIGRLVAVVLMLGGIGLVGTLAASIGAAFLGHETSQEFKEVMRRLDGIEAALEELRRERPS